MAFVHQLAVLPVMKNATTVDDLAGDVVELTGVTDKGFDYVRGAGATFTGVLEGSVALLRWETIHDLAASGQGVVAAQYNYVRIRGTAEGLVGTGTLCCVAGKESCS